MTKPNYQPKLNSRQHLVLINTLKGMNQTDSYAAVYGHDDNYLNLAQRASNLFSNVNFKAELEKRQEGQLAKVEASVLSQTEKRQILADIARTSLTDHLDDDGNIKLNRAKAKALKEYYKRTHTDQNGNPISTSSVKLIDAISAIQEDNKMMGHYAPRRHEVAKRVQFDIRFMARKAIVADDTVLLAEGETIKELEGQE